MLFFWLFLGVTARLYYTFIELRWCVNFPFIIIHHPSPCARSLRESASTFTTTCGDSLSDPLEHRGRLNLRCLELRKKMGEFGSGVACQPKDGVKKLMETTHVSIKQMLCNFFKQANNNQRRGQHDVPTPKLHAGTWCTRWGKSPKWPYISNCSILPKWVIYIVRRRKTSS